MESSANARLARRSLAVGLASVLVALVGCGTEPAVDAVPTAGEAPEAETPVAAPTIGPGSPGWVDEERVLAAAAEPGSWLAHGQTYEELRFSRLNDVNRQTVGRLGLAWYKDLNNRHRMQSTPLVIDGVLYFTDPWSVAYALDAATGEEIWRFDPETDRRSMRYSCCGGAVNRGLAAYRGRLYFATFDARLVAIDQATGEKVWDVDTSHYPSHSPYTITGAVRAVAGKVFIGQSSSEWGLRGYLSAYDADTGELAWRFFMVPGNPELGFEHPELEAAAETWGGNWWEFGGGGTPWNAIVYDAKYDQLLVGTGNGAPWPRKIRSPGGGDNLYLGGVIALDPHTGRMNWFYQMTPADNWDFNAAQDIALLDMEIDGEMRSVALQAPKNAFFYVLDREDGELLRANQYVRQNWATHIDMATGRPVENDDMKWDEAPQWVAPSNAGGHSWQPMSVDPDRGIAYFAVQDMSAYYMLPKEFVETGQWKLNDGFMSLGVEFGRPGRDGVPPQPESKGYLKAFDPLTGEEAWVVQRATPYNGGVLATAGGVVFQGDGGGQFAAFDADDGSLLWEFDTLGAADSAPITYEVDGVQYVATLAAGGVRNRYNDGRLLVFKLDGDLTIPVATAPDIDIPEPPALTASAEQLEQGRRHYNRVCVWCHGMGAVGTVNADLRLMTAETHQRFQAIVRGGLLRDSGMESFADAVTAEETDLIHQYVISQTIAAREVQLAREREPAG
ncbi:MAG: PQQ-dependent dehydrogenase, methanol/ethanol family [Gammaproteobacteria bacterium]|nr:PQQ-dependent dehydrogenase, methanol/ethanol family [Gammaproteobacteria bacterium]